MINGVNIPWNAYLSLQNANAAKNPALKAADAVESKAKDLKSKL